MALWKIKAEPYYLAKVFVLESDNLDPNPSHSLFWIARTYVLTREVLIATATRKIKAEPYCPAKVFVLESDNLDPNPSHSLFWIARTYVLTREVLIATATSLLSSLKECRKYLFCRILFNWQRNGTHWTVCNHSSCWNGWNGWHVLQ